MFEYVKDQNSNQDKKKSNSAKVFDEKINIYQVFRIKFF